MANLGAVVQTQEYSSIPDRAFVTWIYDLDQPRLPESADPHFRYACVDMLGPYNNKADALKAARAAVG